MKKCLRVLFIPLCLLVCFTWGSHPNAQTNPEQKPTPTAQGNQEKRTTSNPQSDQEKKPNPNSQTAPGQKPTTPEKTTTTAPEQKTAVNLQDYVGRYEADPSRAENFILDVFLEKDELWIKPSHSPKSQLAAKGTDSFVITAVLGPIRFNRDAKGLVQSLTIEGTAASGGQLVTAKKLVLPAPSLKGSTTFRLKGYPNARVVAVAGSFNTFNQSQLLCGKEADGWVCRIDLTPGKYTYKFVIDGDWILDPDNPTTEDDERGLTNSLLVVK